MPVADFDFDWRALGAEIERHPQFPQPHECVVPAGRAIEHTLEVRIWERGAGETMSSGTGIDRARSRRPSCGGWCDSPARRRYAQPGRWTCGGVRRSS
jgi:hypothetical protein